MNNDPQSPDSVIDLEYIRTFSDGDEDFVNEMIVLFSEKIPVEITQLKNSVAEKLWDQAYKATHDLKSSTSFVGMEYLKQDVLDLERCTKFELDLEKVPGLVKKVVRECEKAIMELQELAAARSLR